MDPAPGLQEVGLGEELPHLGGVLAGPEEIGLLLGGLDLPAAVGALAVLELALGPEGLAGGAVQALVGALVDVALLVHGAEDGLHGLQVGLVGGADEAVIGDVHELPQVLDALGGLHDGVHELLGGDPGLFGLVLDLLAVLVGAGEEDHVGAPHSLIPGHDVRGHGAVGMADVEPAGRIIDGGGDKEFLFTRFAHR